MKLYKYKLEIYDIEIYITFNFESNKFKKQFKNLDWSKLEFEDENNWAGIAIPELINIKSKKASFLIAFNLNSNQIKEYNNLHSIMVHECTHTTERIWNYINEKNKGSEANAYLNEYLFNCCIKSENKNNELK